jgi:ABC-type multidrug transport system fused ATPase/permease subunit
MIKARKISEILAFEIQDFYFDWFQRVLQYNVFLPGTGISLCFQIMIKLIIIVIFIIIMDGIVSFGKRFINFNFYIIKRKFNELKKAPHSAFQYMFYNPD